MVSILHILIPALTFLVLVLFKKYTTNIPSSTLPKGPKGLPIIGNLHQLDNSNLHLQLWNLSKIYGPLFSLKIGFKQAIVVSTPKLAEEIFKDHDLHVCNRPPSLGSQKLSYNGSDIIFSPYNDSWREIRKTFVVHFFSSKKISSFSYVRKSEVEEMLKKISGHVCSSKISNLSEIIMNVSSSIICRIAFGKKYEDEAAEKSRFHDLLNETQAIFLSFFVSDYIPFTRWIDKLTGSLSRLDNTYNALDVFFEQVLKEHLSPDYRKKDAGEEDIVDILLELKKKGLLSIDLTNNHIKAILMNLLVAATDTTAATSVWVMTGLMKNPRVMMKAQEEIRAMCENKDFIDEDDISRLVYFRAVVKETMRFYPPGPLLPREITKSFTLNGHEIQANTLLYVNIWAIQRDHATWEDSEEFYPERFLNNDIDFKGQDFELIPFGAGRRICPGMPMGIVTVELITANLLSPFDWEMPVGMTVNDIDVEGLPGLARHKKNHLRLVAKNHT